MIDQASLTWEHFSKDASILCQVLKTHAISYMKINQLSPSLDSFLV